MGSKGRIPPHMRRPLPGPGMLHPDPFGPGSRPPPGGFPFDGLPPIEIMEQKLDAQQIEMRTLLTENQRIAATHSTLRQELAAAQQELQRSQALIGRIKDEQEQQMRVVFDKMAKMESDLKASESVKEPLHKARAEAQKLMSVRQELVSKVQQLKEDLHRSHGDTQLIPALMSELDSLRQEYQHCRATYDYERKLRVDHSEQLQVMEKNYVSMVREVEALRSELSKASDLDKSGAVYASNAGYKEGETPKQHSTGQNAYEDGYGVPQGRGPSSGVTNYGGGPGPVPAPARAGYDARGAAYDVSRNSSYDAPRAAGYDAPRAGSYEAPRGAGYDAPRGAAYDASSRGAAVTQSATGPGNTAAAYGTTQTQAPNYGSAQTANYGSAQAPAYGSTQAQAPAYGSAQAQAPAYGSTQAQAPAYGSAQAPPYGSTQAPAYGSAQAPAYGAAQPPAYGSAQAPSPYGSAQGPPPYGTSHPTNSAASGGGGGVYEAPRGGTAARR